LTFSPNTIQTIFQGTPEVANPFIQVIKVKEGVSVLKSATHTSTSMQFIYN
jgi:hypothetical protein